MRTLHLPTHKELVAELEFFMGEEQARSPNPLTVEAFSVNILANYVFNMRFQKDAQAKEKALQEEIRNKVIKWTDATIRALALEKK